ncbi:MAG: sigma-70 family RNA polymerase sigma factor [Opitutaceae bacterium]
MALSAERPGIPGPRPTAFPTTQWSLILEAGGGTEAAARASLEVLCQRYWYPVYCYLRQRGNSHHAAEDLAQGFFAHLLACDRLALADPRRGRFRTFVLTALAHYATGEWRRAHAARRGGAAAPIPFEPLLADELGAGEPPSPELTPEAAFDRNWARALIRQGVDALRRDYAAQGRTQLFAALLPHAFGDAEGELQATAAARLDLNEHAFAVAVSRLRRRLRQQLRVLVSDTLAAAGETDDELHILLAALSPRGRVG